MSESDRLAQEIARATARIGQVRARELLREMRSAAIAKAKAQKAGQRRRFVLGGLVERCGLAEWDHAELAGMLLDAKQRAEESVTMRLAFRKRGSVSVTGAAPTIS